MSFPVKRLPDLLNDMLVWLIANQDKITDFNEGSVIRSYCEAVGIEIEKLYIRTRTGFDVNLLSLPYNAFNFTRQSAQKAVGSVVFSRAGTTGDVSIPIGTQIATPNGITFETSAAGSIADGNQDSGSITIVATEGGAVGNVPASTITIIMTPIIGVETITNAAATTGGLDEESDAAFKQRFSEFTEGLGQSSVPGLIAKAKSVDGVRSAAIFEHFPPSSSYNVTIYIEDGNGNAPQGLIDVVELEIIGDGSATYPGVKGAGIKVRILAPTKITIDVTTTISGNGLVSETAMEYNIQEAITSYINGLTIGNDMIREKLQAAIMNVNGVYDIDSMTAPASNTSITSDEVVRVGTIAITFS